MDQSNIIWTFAFSILLTTSSTLMYLISSYIGNKPLGHQTLFDVVLRDNYFLSQFTNFVLIGTDILFQFGSVAIWLAENPNIATLICFLHMSAFVSLCIHSGLVAIVRLLCVMNINFMEETIGEIVVRSTVTGLTVFITALFSIVSLYVGGLSSGEIFSTLTRQSRLDQGKRFERFFDSKN